MSKMKHFSICSTKIIFFCALLLLPFRVVQGVQISPLRQTITIDPGSEQVVRLEVTNTEQDEKTVTPGVDSFTIDEKTGAAVFGARDTSVDWVRVTPESLTLRPGETNTFHFTITIPKEASPGGHYLGLFAQSAPAVGGVGIGTRIGSLLFLTVGGEISELLVVEQFAPASIVTILPRVHLGVRLKNIGNIHLEPKGDIVAYTMTQEEIGRVSLNGGAKKVLPDAFWQEESEVPLTWKQIGRVTMRLQLAYGTTNQRVVSTTAFWYIPWQTLLVVLSSGVAVLFWYAVKKKSR